MRSTRGALLFLAIYVEIKLCRAVAANAVSLHSNEASFMGLAPFETGSLFKDVHLARVSEDNLPAVHKGVKIRARAILCAVAARAALQLVDQRHVPEPVDTLRSKRCNPIQPKTVRDVTTLRNICQGYSLVKRGAKSVPMISAWASDVEQMMLMTACATLYSLMQA
jgi:hypothetical protein